MMLAGAADVVATNLDWIGLQSRPIPGTTEAIATLMVVVVFLGLPLAQQRRAHIALDVSPYAPAPLRRPLAGLQHGLHAIFYGAIAFFGWQQAVQSTRVGEFAAGAIAFPVWPARAVLAVGATLMALQCAADLVALLPRRRRAG